MDIQETTKEYYGKVLKKSADLKTNACTSGKYPQYILEIMKNIHEDVLSSYYGCGLVIPDFLDQTHIIDLGCGTGRDAYILSKLVGEKGSVLGIDMTDEQLDVANKYIDYHREKYGYQKSNVTFKKGYIEELDKLNLNKDFYDIVVSNCVVNLSNNKQAVFEQVYQLLKTGGEFYFSDIYSDRRIPENLRNNKVLWGECLSGALYWNDFINLAKKCGFTDPRLVSSNRITIRNQELEKEVGNIKFYSATYRLFKLPELLEPDCEDYGQAVMYTGTIMNHESSWELDNHHRFEKEKVMTVCGNTYNMLHHTRFWEHFIYLNGGTDTHFGIFPDCGKNMPFEDNRNSNRNYNAKCC